MHEKGSLDFDTNGVPTTGDPGAWKLYMAYDALGRLISIQKPWTGGTDHRKAWLYYDGVRRIVEVFEDPVQTAPGTVVGGPGTAGGSGGYITYTDREYVWGPDYVDECLWQVTRPGDVLHVLQDASMDVVATLDSTGAVTRQWTYDPYGQPIAADQLTSGAHNRLGHHGLFFDRLDATTPNVELVAAARGLYHNRNRTYEPRIGRYTSSDPNETGMSVLSESMLGASSRYDLSRIDAVLMYGDGLSLYGYMGANPGRASDPMGLFLGYDDLVMWGFGALRGGMEEMVGQYGTNMSADLDWAMDWDMDDDWHTRLDNSWVALSFAIGAYRGLMEEVESSLMIDYVYAGTGKALGKGAKAVARPVKYMRQLDSRIIHNSYYTAKRSSDHLPGENAHHLVEQQMGGPWRKGLKGEGPAINVERGFHLQNIRVAFNEAYKKAKITDRGNMTKQQAYKVINEVYRTAPALCNAAKKYIKGNWP